MTGITILVKNVAKNKNLLASVKKTFLQEGYTLKIIQEKPPQEPIISKAPLGADVVNATHQLISQYFSAERVVAIIIEGILGNVAYVGLKNIVSQIPAFFGTNNKQKGNAWGAKVELKKQVDSDRVRTFHFFLDNIPESRLFDAVSRVQERIESLDGFLGEEYLKEIKHLGFSFDSSNAEWKLIGVERFNGETEVPSPNAVNDSLQKGKLVASVTLATKVTKSDD